ncbi:hypothetical protein ANO14919_044670 [Xylariales sp. No.14919]|nr:hypothetical protein ANO14919_044670 [Xylariales sp. No.14919]
MIMATITTVTSPPESPSVVDEGDPWNQGRAPVRSTLPVHDATFPVSCRGESDVARRLMIFPMSTDPEITVLLSRRGKGSS